MKANGIIPGDLETDAKCTSPHPSHKTSKNILRLSNPNPKEVIPSKSPELRSKAKTLTSNPPCWSLAIGENQDSSSVSSAPFPIIEIGKDTLLRPIRIRPDWPSQGVPGASLSTVSLPQREKDSGRRSAEERNGYCKSKERSCHRVTSPGGSGMVPERACAKRKGVPVLDGGRERKRPCFQDLGRSFQNIVCKPTLDRSPKARNEETLKPQEAAMPSRSPPSSWASITRAKRGLEEPSCELEKGSSLQQMQEDADFSSPPPAWGKQDLQAPRGQSQSSRANQPETRETSSVTSLLHTPTEQPRASTSPSVSLSSGGGSDNTNISLLAGSCFPGSPGNEGTARVVFPDGPEKDSGEDRDLSDLELDLGAFADGASSSDSDDEPLLSLQEILARSARLPATPEKGAYPAPDVPVHKLAPLVRKSRPLNYKNTLEQILKEKKEKQRSRETELKLLLSCQEDLLKLEDSPGDGIEEEGLPLEGRAILRRFSVVSNGLPDLHPGEAVFSPAEFGRLFSQQSLDLRSCAVVPQSAEQRPLLQASPDELLFLISTRKLVKAYRSSPCQPAVARWLFQIMSVHVDRGTSTQILRTMTDIALNAADQITVNKNRKFEVWTPSIQDVVLIFLNMGVSFVTLFPPGAQQPPFTEADILQRTNSLEDVGSRKQDHGSFPEHCYENVIKYLGLCAALCPRAYSDAELLLLLTVVCRVSLETGLQLHPMEDICWLLHHLLNNTADWASQLPRICLALVDLTDNHHNLRWLVQLLPDHKRGKQLRKHLSMSIISKLLNQRCTYKPGNTEFQLSALQQYLPRMRPSSLLSDFFSGKQTEGQREGEVSQDQQAYYLCYSLLSLANEASNFDSFPSNQKDQLKLLSAVLEKYIKGDIREGEQWLYRSKVKDLVARIYTRWQVLLLKARLMQGKLHDYWQPLPEDTLSSSQESQPDSSEAVMNTDPPSP